MYHPCVARTEGLSKKGTCFYDLWTCKGKYDVVCITGRKDLA